MVKDRYYVDVIMFDLDGTLVDSLEGIIEAVGRTLAEMGKPGRSDEEIISYIGTGVKDLIKRSSGEESEEFVNKGVKIFSKYFKDHCDEKSRLYPNVRHVLDIYGKKKLFIVTNRNADMARRTLDNFGISGYFRDVIGGDDDLCQKPSACPLKRALFAACKDEERALMVGDMDLDVIAGKKAGILTCGVTYGIGRAEDIEKAEPDYVVDDIIKLKDLII